MYSIAAATASVSRLVALNDKVILVGYADGLVILWDLATETVIGQARLHGAVQHAALFDNDALAQLTRRVNGLDIGALTYSRCQLTRAVWTDVKVVWRRGQVPRKSLDSITTA